MKNPKGAGVDLGSDYHVNLELESDKDLPEALGRLLVQWVQAAGGQAGALTTRLPELAEPLTSLYGIDLEEHAQLVKLMETLARQPGPVPPEQLAQLEEEARRGGTGRPLAIPIRSGGRPVGVFCLWHPGEAPHLLQEQPGLVHLNLDQVDMGLQGARLLERLLHERKWLEAVVQHSTDGVVIHDPQGRVMGYNLTMARLSGWKIGEAVGESGQEAFPLTLLEDSSVFDSSVPPLARVSGTPWLSATDPVEARLLARSGESVEVEVVGAPLFDRQGQPLGWVMTIRDITRRKEKERLHKLFLSAVSHELQTPIAIIRGYAGLLADPEIELEAASVRKQAQIIVEEAQRLEVMVHQMLYATRIQAGGLKLQRQELDVAHWLKGQVERLKPILWQKGVKLSLARCKSGLMAKIDEDKLQQVLTNLIENAAKYAGRKPVRLAVEEEQPGWLRLEVQDSGPGIPKTDQERIFTAFERGGDPLKQLVRGSGLGLYICKAIIEAHGGKIGVETHPKGGAVFFFTLPRERSPRCHNPAHFATD